MPTKKTSAKSNNGLGGQKSLKRRERFLRKGLLIFILIFGAVGGLILLLSHAATPPAPAIYLSSTSTVFGGSTTFTVQIRENSGTTTVNAVQANLSYPSALLTVNSIDYTGTAFGNAVQSSFGGGVINIARGVSCGTTCPPISGDQLIATVSFKTAATGGTAPVAFTTGTAVVNSTTNTNILPSLSSAIGLTFTVDTTPPTVSITSPAGGAVLAGGSTINVTATATDASSSITKVEFYVDGVLASTVTASPYTFPWNTSGVSLAAHTLVVKGYDSSGNIGTSSTVNVTLTDQTPPSVPGSFRITGTTTSTISLAWNASTDNVGVVSYKLSRNGTLIATLTAATLTYNDTGLSPATTYNYSISAVDAANNTSTSATTSGATSTLTPGDLNGDGKVDGADLSFLVANYGTTNSTADINKDGIVDALDLSILLSHYGT